MTLEQELADSLSPLDEQAKKTVFHKIYDKYFKLVWFCAYRFLGNKEDTDEIADDVFVKLYLRTDASDIQNIKYYLTRSARNLSLNRLRAKRPTEVLDERTVGQYTFSEGSDLLERVKNLVTKEEFELLSRHVLEGYSLVEIAKSTGESANTVKSKYRRLCKKLKSELEDLDHE